MKHPQKAQKRVQQEICDRLIKSEYGKFLGIRSLQDWQQVPIVDYEDLKPWIDGVGGHSSRGIEGKPITHPLQAQLTTEPILFYEKTSGSRSAAKCIPYTKSLRRSFNQMFCVWAHDLIRNGPAFSTGKIYFCISPQFQYCSDKTDLTPLAFLPYQGRGELDAPLLVGEGLGERLTEDAPNPDHSSLQDDSEYLDRWLRWLLHPFLISPANLHHLRTPEEFKRQLCLALLQAEQLETISIWSPTFLKIHLDYIQTHRTELRQSLKLPAERDRFLCEPEIPWTKLWPELKLISCWDSACAADPAQVLRDLFPGVMVQGKGLLATEAPITIPLIAAQGCVPVLDEVFFEFEDESGKIYLLQDLQIGQEYNIILSQKGGLYRYRIGDRVRVTHYYLNTPCLEFLGRDRSISDLVGEKLHEEFVSLALKQLALEGTSFQCLVPATTPEAHYILLLDKVNAPTSAIARRAVPKAIAQQLEQFLNQSPHYRHARLLGQLSPVQVLVSQQIPEILTSQRIASGKKWGDIKHSLLCNRPIEEELLARLQQADCLRTLDISSVR
ncbi:GH3 auxin-responsive promoter-binding protein [Allocoleopsis franciscana PCC 7113]|uniref:GH3 auxin-responsive promoter-binding protein n=1 Tax=Allocoleopsis franciscana PCC 7113 TaxID=1173027 RepID=K9WEX0_9CYAN|nr:GH3 auxin-responsive promoter-binding protein [Allocoleopsis franciscana PCC 7113]